MNKHTENTEVMREADHCRPIFKHAELWGLNDGTLPRGVLVFPFSDNLEPGLLMCKSNKHAEAVLKLLSRAMWNQETGRVWLDDGKGGE